ncbi:MAG: phenylacetic acid degradation operon negative regulatory protein PaaX [Pseudorhodoplanes sp.]|nr:phenylacetic acid degradation operon negative regulatory protein PaaX [Pseudorhodoplanes sp.]
MADRVHLSAIVARQHIENIPVPLSPAIASFVRRFHAHKPTRIWSLIVTLYGDAIVPRGGSLWIGSLIDIMELFDIDAGHVRTAISRLSSDGWLLRVKRGRASHYRLSKRGEGVFLAATQRIYFDEQKPFDGNLRIAILEPDLADPAGTRRALRGAGFVALSPSVQLSLAEPPASLSARKGVYILNNKIGEAERHLASAAWTLPATAAAYRTFTAQFASLESAVERKDLSPQDALVTRILMIHAYRRIVLRDPGLPALLLPDKWPGHAARALTGRIYRRLLGPSERYLDAHARNEDGPLPATSGTLSQRFAS